jgi:hypothetical protein
MPLSIPGGGDVKPYIRFQASMNSWQMSAEGGGTEEFEFSEAVVVDIQNVQLGWLLLETGNRDWKPWPNNTPVAKPAEGDYKAGFEAQIYAKNIFGSEPVRSYSSNSTGNVMFIQELYNAAEASAEFSQAMSPVIRITGSKPIKVGKGNTRVPQFEIVKWIPRPDVFGASINEKPAPKPAPAPKAAPKAMSEDTEF